MSVARNNPEPVVISRRLPPWNVLLFLTGYPAAVRAEQEHDSAGGGLIAHSTRQGIDWIWTERFGEPPAAGGLIPWQQIRDLLRAATTPALTAALAAAHKAYLEAWRATPGDSQARGDTLWAMRDAADAIKDRLLPPELEPEPLGQLDLLDLLAVAA